MFALVASVIFFLSSLGVIEDTADIKYLPLALGFWALHFALGVGLPWTWPGYTNRNPQ
jgi:hypothetical protein